MAAAYYVLPIYFSVCFAQAPDVFGGCLTDFCQDDSALLQTRQSTPGSRGFDVPASNPVLAQSRTEDEPCGFKNFFLHHTEGPGIDKWVHYFPIYEEHFGKFCRGSDKITMAEVGVQSGGSLLMWNHGFGRNLKLLVGMDVNNDTKSWEQLGSNIKVEIGDQGDANFWKNIKMKYPEGFDIFLDDGSHVPEHQFTTFVHMWSAIRPGGVLMIEDVHGINPLLKWILEGHKTAAAEMEGLYYSDGKTGAPDKISTPAHGDFLGHHVASGNASKVQNEVESIKIYPFVLAITKRKTPLGVLARSLQGNQWIPYKQTAL